MYVYQFMDATWRISHLTNSKEPSPAWRTEARRLYDGIYDSRAEAEAAIRQIRALISPL